ncbi:MAG: DUF2007 domain-containing protein [Anaerolineales bacterium]|nr:DUF2007 domain-containing protein [Anaerolineales bacterium]
MIDATANNLPWLHRNREGEATDDETTPGGEETTKWVVIRTNISPGEAVVIRGRLESEGIPAVVQQEAVGSVLGLTVGPLGSAKVLVPESLAEKALEILAETFEVEGDDEEAAEA